jgi:hypothetical protein
MNANTTVLAVLDLRGEAGERSLASEGQLRQWFERRQVALWFGDGAVGSPGAGLDEHQLVIVGGRAFARNEDGGVHGGLEWIALAKVGERVSLEHLAHTQFAGQRKKRVRDNESEATSRS